MKGVCKICGCTEEQACLTDAGPCSWVMGKTKDLCSACVIVLEDKGYKKVFVPKACRYCGLLLRDGKDYTCSKGRFDEPYLAPGGHQWYAWSGIRRPNKAVAAAQKRCPLFQVHDLVKLVEGKERNGRAD